VFVDLTRGVGDDAGIEFGTAAGFEVVPGRQQSAYLDDDVRAAAGSKETGGERGYCEMRRRAREIVPGSAQVG
jgi:hypothetical protein